MRPLSFLSVAAVLVLAAPVSAAGLKPWVGGSGSFGTYVMKDANRALDGLNDSPDWKGLWLWPIRSGPGLGATAGLDFGRGFSCGIGFDRLLASSGAEDADRFFRLRLPANAVRAIGEYSFPHQGALGAHIGVAGGIVTVTGSVVDSFAYGVRGSGPLVDVYLGANWWDQPRCGLFLSVGYRYARVGEVKIGGSVAHNPDTSKFTLDYSGVLLRLGFKLPLTAPAGAPAATVGAGVKPWIGISGSWGAYAMGDVNRDIADRNRELAGTGPSLNRIHGGFGLGASAGLDFPARLSLGIGYDRLAAATEAGGGAGSLKIRHPANTFRALAEYRLPGRGNLEARLGVAGGTVMEAGSESVKFTGSGPLLEAYASSDWRAAPRLALTASLGYRYARVSEVKADQEVMFKAGGSRFTVDYSGVLLRLGLKAALAK